MPERTLAESDLRVSGKRTIEEQLVLLDQCLQCEAFRGTYCDKDKGCDRELMFLIRLARRECTEWKTL